MFISQLSFKNLHSIDLDNIECNTINCVNKNYEMISKEHKYFDPWEVVRKLALYIWKQKEGNY